MKSDGVEWGTPPSTKQTPARITKMAPKGSDIVHHTQYEEVPDPDHIFAELGERI
jgi:hypothetical protein